MKKIFLVVLSIMMLGLGQTMAQDKGGKATEKAAPKKAKTEATKDEAGKLKKDGTPDMRYKDNKGKKEEAKPTGPLKKDGTPDKRYKGNKEGAAK